MNTPYPPRPRLVLSPANPEAARPPSGLRRRASLFVEEPRTAPPRHPVISPAMELLRGMLSALGICRRIPSEFWYYCSLETISNHNH